MNNRSNNNKSKHKNKKQSSSTPTYTAEDLRKEKAYYKQLEKKETQMCSFYYNFEIETDDVFSSDKKLILSYTTIKSNSELEAEEEVRNIYEQRQTPIYKLNLLSVDKI